jgi:iron complex transport system substrate-binding protein
MSSPALLVALLALAAPAPRWLGAARPAGVPARIVTLAPSLTEWAFALGAGARVVGVSRYDAFPAEVADLPRVGGFLDPSVEGILALRPSLVLAAPGPGNRAPLERLAGLGVPVLVLPASRLEDVYATLEVLGPALGAGPRARRLATELRARLAALEARARAAPPVRVAVVYGYQPLVLGGPESLAGALLALLGARNVVEGAVEYPQVSPEVLRVAAPEVILDGAAAHGLPGSAPWAGWAAVPAVRDRRVVPLPEAGLLVPGPRLVDGAQALAAALHPALFAPPPAGQSGASNSSKASSTGASKVLPSSRTR